MNGHGPSPFEGRACARPPTGERNAFVPGVTDNVERAHRNGPLRFARPAAMESPHVCAAHHQH